MTGSVWQRLGSMLGGLERVVAGQGDAEAGSIAWSGFGPNAPTVRFGGGAGDRETESAAAFVA
jgi:hypothetical protein